ncbi:hypothetical protein CBR_g12939 [Chara braunii]|uniref:Integrase catalytic domain-containing protein n=1 Tax=Chara braunii TaxID=69332 RepID=A0A388KT92_CHABU|nr:hypothetical protein CBR_g12939 [Chara braunii]|eukprot:GBG73222.1 hypothetical protein CBR_g12939 [Chara braunii]
MRSPQEPSLNRDLGPLGFRAGHARPWLLPLTTVHTPAPRGRLPLLSQFSRPTNHFSVPPTSPAVFGDDGSCGKRRKPPASRKFNASWQRQRQHVSRPQQKLQQPHGCNSSRSRLVNTKLVTKPRWTLHAMKPRMAGYFDNSISRKPKNDTSRPTKKVTKKVFIRHETTFKAMDKKIATLQAEISTLHAANSQQQTLNDQLQTDVSMGLAQLSAAASTGSAVVDCCPALAVQAKQLEERINHLVASLGDISKFAGASTVSNQLQTLSDRADQRPASATKEWKMSNFKIEKFDDYHKTDPLQWWMAFNVEADVHHTPAHRRLDALYLQLIGGAQAFMTHMAVMLECTIANLHTKITWEEFEKKWKTSFMVNNDKRHAMNKIFRIYQGQQTSREWLTEWQRLVATPELNSPFDAIRVEFFARSCDALTAALGTEFQYETFDDLILKARELIQGNRRAANETRQQPGYVEKGKGQRTPQVAAVQHGPSEDPAAASTSSDEDVAAAIPPQRSRPRGGKQKAKPASTDGARQAPWTKFDITEDRFKKLSTAGSAATSLPNPPESAALLAASLTSGDGAVVASSHIEYENYAVKLVPLLNQPRACATVPPSDNEPVASPALLSEDPSTWASLEKLEPLTVEDFQWLPLPSTGSLPTPHCNALMAHLREYLHAAVPPPSTDGGVAVVDLRNYLANIDRGYATQRYVENDAPLLYIRIQIGKATCSALIDCGATRNYISQDSMHAPGLARAFEGKVSLRTSPCEAVSFDILDTKFDMILGMLWLQREDHPVNFHRRTVHIRDRRGELVPSTMPLPHPLIGCHVVSAASIRQSIRRNDIEEMGICFLHALPPGDQPKTDTSDPRIIELLDSYEDVFQTPARVIPDRPIRHGITLEDGVVPPRGCIYRMGEEELQVLRAQLDDLLAKGWIRPSCLPYGAPILFVRKKNKDLRLCIDYRKLNAQTIKNAGPLPRIDDLLERLGGAKYFSKFDLKSGYHQIEIQPRDRYKTSFKTRYWIVMPFSLTNAPATFQAAMTTKFRDLLDRTVLIYLDDILVYSRTLNEHLEHLRSLLERFRIAKYKANRNKCEFAQQELEYLGHYITSQGIRPLADKVQAIQDWSDLKCTTDVRSFLDLASYYMRFVKGFQGIAAPLSRLQSPLVPFEFSNEARHAFHTLKTVLLQAPVLSIYDPTLPTKVTTDASICHRNKGCHQLPYGELKPLPIPREPGLSIAMDVTGPFPRDRLGHDGILTVVDRLSKYAQFLPCKYHATAPELAQLSHTGWFCSHGVPEDIVSDRDTRFMSAFWTALMVEFSTSMKSSSAQHPQTDWQTERAHQTAQMMLRTLIRPDQKDWVDRLPNIEFAYNTSVHLGIGVTPFELHHGGRKGRIFTDILLPRAADIDAACSPASTRKYKELLAKARANMQKAQVRMQQQANRRRIPCPIRAGDLVWVTFEEFALEQHVSRKLLPKWFGPWKVTSAAGDDPAGPSFII